MKYPIPCMKCAFSEEGRCEMELYSLPAKDNNLYEFKCRHGHLNVVLVPQEKFEILFEIGLNAVIDGYYREAVSSVASALERFYEFYVRVVAQKYDRLSPFEASWKNLANRSERQLGAFNFAHVINSGAPPDLLSNKSINFRNDVIHKGKIPAASQAIEFAGDVLRIIMKTLSELQASSEDALHRVVEQQRWAEIQTQQGNKRITGHHEHPVAASAGARSNVPLSFDVRARLEQIRKRRAKFTTKN